MFKFSYLFLFLISLFLAPLLWAGESTIINKYARYARAPKIDISALVREGRPTTEMEKRENGLLGAMLKELIRSETLNDPLPRAFHFSGKPFFILNLVERPSCLPLLRCALESGAKITSEDRAIDPLLRALCCRNMAAASLLKERGAVVRPSLIFDAIYQERSDIMNWLLDNGVRADQEDTPFEDFALKVTPLFWVADSRRFLEPLLVMAVMGNRERAAAYEKAREDNRILMAQALLSRGARKDVANVSPCDPYAPPQFPYVRAERNGFMRLAALLKFDEKAQ